MGMTTCVCVNAEDMPDDVYNFCEEREISTHYQNDVVLLEDNGNPFSEWIKSLGFEFKKKYEYVAIIAT